MKNKMNKKLMLDVLMTVMFIALMDYAFTGLLLHEIIGLAIFAFFFFHKLINFKWIKSVTKRLFDPNLKARTKVMYALDALLLVDIVLITLSGVFISTEMFPNLFSVADRFLWVTIHHIASYAGLIAISLHVGLHWKMIMAAFRKMFRIKKPSIIRTALVRLMALLFIVAGIKSSFDVGMAEKLALTSDDESDDTAITDETALVGSLNAIINTEESVEDTAPETLKIYGKGNGDGDHEEEEEDDDDHEEEDDHESYDTETVQATSDAQITSTQVVDSAPSLSNYLSKLYCTGCSKHCPLSAPQCNIGVGQAQTATSDYYVKYAVPASEQTYIPSVQITSSAAAQTPKVTASPVVDTAPSLLDYLSKFYCTGCGKHCPLSAPQCSVGVRQAEESATEYYVLYAADLDTALTDPTTNDTTDTDSNNNESLDLNPITDNVFADYLPIMGLYIGGAYYTIELIDKKKEKKSDNK